MNVPEFAREWLFDAERPKLRNYPCQLNSDDELPELESSLEAIGEYQRRLWANRAKALLLVFHGPDASGKDSLIRTLATYADPAGFHAWSFGRPEGAEARHDFLWRVTPFLPGYGEMVAFNRSHHEAVMAERLWPVLAPEHYDWQARYDAIRGFETHLAREGTTVLKFWLNVSEDEHQKRLLKRLDKPRKRWKFEESDIDGWQRRKEYTAAAEQAITATHTPDAPWMILPGDDKSQARAIAAAVIAEALMQMAPEYPVEDEDVVKHYRSVLTEQDK